MTSQDLIEKYEGKISTIEEIIDDLDRNINIAEKGVLVTGDVSKIQNMKSTRKSFLSNVACYNEFIEDLKEIEESDSVYISVCDEYVEGTNMNCVKCNKPKYTHHLKR